MSLTIYFSLIFGEKILGSQMHSGLSFVTTLSMSVRVVKLRVHRHPAVPSTLGSVSPVRECLSMKQYPVLFSISVKLMRYCTSYKRNHRVVAVVVLYSLTGFIYHNMFSAILVGAWVRIPISEADNVQPYVC